VSRVGRVASGIELAERTIKAARAAGAAEAEAFFEASRGVTLQMRDSAVQSYQLWDSGGIGLRVLVGHSLGYAYTSDLSPAGVDLMIASSLGNAAINTPDPWNELPSPGSPRDGSGLADERVVLLGVQAKADLLARAGQAAGKQAAVRVLGSEYGDQDRVVAIANSRGVAGHYRSTSAYIRVEAAAEGSGETQAAQAFGYTRGPDGLSPEAIGREAAKKALDRLGGCAVPTGEGAVVLAPLAACQLLAQVARLLSGEAVLKGRSPFAELLGERVADSDLTIVDDPLAAEGPGARPFDAEGVESRRLVVVQCGNLASFLHNHYTGRRCGQESTGNARRSSYRGTPEVGASNFILPGGDHTPEQLLAAAGQGLHVTELLGLQNTSGATGRFSAGVTGCRIRDGAPGQAVRETVVSGHFVDVLARIKMVANDARFLPGAQSIGSPSLLIDHMVIAGT
jgi:PmbA protein